MVRFLRSTAACFVVLLTTIHAAGQDLTPALADQFSRGVADLKAGNLDAAEAAISRHPPGRRRCRAGPPQPRDRAAAARAPRAGARGVRCRLAHRSLVRAGAAPCRHEPGRARAVPRRARGARARRSPDAARGGRLACNWPSVCQRLDDRLCVANAYRHVTQLAPDDRRIRVPARVGAARGVGVGVRAAPGAPSGRRPRAAGAGARVPAAGSRRPGARCISARARRRSN